METSKIPLIQSHHQIRHRHTDLGRIHLVCIPHRTPKGTYCKFTVTAKATIFRSRKILSSPNVYKVRIDKNTIKLTRREPLRSRQWGALGIALDGRFSRLISVSFERWCWPPKYKYKGKVRGVRGLGSMDLITHMCYYVKPENIDTFFVLEPYAFHHLHLNKM